MCTRTKTCHFSNTSAYAVPSSSLGYVSKQTQNLRKRHARAMTSISSSQKLCFLISLKVKQKRDVDNQTICINALSFVNLK